jgi:hypothetical protein
VLKERIREMRASGMTLQAIAGLLNEERVPTLRGGAEWRPSAVQSVTGNRRPDPSGSGENAKGTMGEGRDLRDISPVAREEARASGIGASLAKDLQISVFRGRVSDGTRTRDRLDHNQELYRLSYAHRDAPGRPTGRATFGI